MITCVNEKTVFVSRQGRDFVHRYKLHSRRPHKSLMIALRSFAKNRDLVETCIEFNVWKLEQLVVLSRYCFS